MKTHRIEAVLLDMGGVLIPVVKGYARAANDPLLIEALRDHGVQSPEELIVNRAQQVSSAYRSLEGLCTQPDLDEVLKDDPPAVRALLLAAFRRQATRPTYAHSRRIVAELAQHYRLGLVSNTVIPGDHHARSMARAGILRHIEQGQWSANFGRRKPDPAIIHHVLALMGVPGRRAVMVGDKLSTDVLAANRAGIRSVWLRRPGAKFEGEARPDFVIQHLGSLPGLLRRLG